MDLTKFIDKHYGLGSLQTEHLEGFEDKTYKVISPKGTYIFKQYRYSEETLALIEAENRLLKELEKIKEYSFPIVIPTVDKELYALHEGSIFRMLTFLDGILLGDAGQTDDMRYSLGSMLAKLNKQLYDCYEPVLRGRQSEWDLRFLELNKSYIHYIEDTANQSLVHYFFLQFNEKVTPKAHLLRKANIHCDANDWNIITDGEKVTGIFDFGDMTYSWLISELAIGMTYIMMNRENPLEAAVHTLKGYHKILPLEKVELDILYYLIAARLCTSVCNSAHGKKKKPESDYMTISEKPAWALLNQWIEINPLKAQKAFYEAAGFQWTPPNQKEELLVRRKKHLSRSLSLSYEEPISMYGAAFQYMYDNQGNTFLDAYNNIMLAGHCHPHVVEAGQRALAQLNTNTRYLYDSINSYAEKLLSKFPQSLNKIIFVNSGSEASDLAIRIAKHYTKKSKVAVLENGYHGNTTTGILASHYKFSAVGGLGKADETIVTAMPKAFGSGFDDRGSSGNHFAGIFKDQIEAYSGEIAAFIAEPIMGCGGQVPLATGYLKKAYELIRSQGGVCISDEVQVGFGRVGSNFWGFELHSVVPDIVILGKPMGNGHPIGAVVTTEEIAESFEKGPEFFSSFGGNPVSCAIGRAVLDVIENEGLQNKAESIGDHLISLLTKLQKKYPIIADVRGHGMFIGMELMNEQGEPLTKLAHMLKNELRKRHVLVGTDGPFNNVIKIKPPLSFNKANAETLSGKIDHVMAAML